MNLRPRDPKIGVPENGWLKMEKPMNKWMIWGFSPLVLEIPEWDPSFFFLGGILSMQQIYGDV